MRRNARGKTGTFDSSAECGSQKKQLRGRSVATGGGAWRQRPRGSPVKMRPATAIPGAEGPANHWLLGAASLEQSLFSGDPEGMVAPCPSARVPAPPNQASWWGEGGCGEASIPAPGQHSQPYCVVTDVTCCYMIPKPTQNPQNVTPLFLRAWAQPSPTDAPPHASPGAGSRAPERNLTLAPPQEPPGQQRNGKEQLSSQNLRGARTKSIRGPP